MSDLSPNVSGNVPGSARLDLGAAARVSRGGETTRNAPAVTAEGGTDQVDLSGIAGLLRQLNELPDVRTDLVERVRAEIRSGEYDIPERFEAALDGLIDEEVEGL